MVIDPSVHRHGRRGAARRAVGPGARHHPARQRPRLSASTARSSGSRRCRRSLTEKTGARGAARGGAGRRRPAHDADAPAQLLEGRRDRHAAEAGEHPLESRPGVRRHADEHAHHHRPAGAADQRVGPDRHDRQAAAAGRDRSAHRADEQELRAGARHPVGLQRRRLAGARQHDRPGVPQQRNARRPGRRHAGTGAARRPP